MKHKSVAPVITWLKITDYMHSWLQHEWGGAMVRDKHVVSLQYLPGAKETLRMETVNDVLKKVEINKSVSDTRMNCIQTALSFDPCLAQVTYDITKEQCELFLPIECPRMCMTETGVLRPWTRDIRMGEVQSAKMQQVVRDAFWRAVETFSKEYSNEHAGERYAQVEMIEEFCDNTNTPAMYIEAMRREWQRRLKRKKK